MTTRCSTDPEPPGIRPAPHVPWGVLLVIFAVAFLVRAGWGLWRSAQAADPAELEFPDEQQYWHMARSLRAGTGLRDELGFRATRMPLYPGLLSLVAPGSNGIVAARAAQWVIGGLTAALTAGLGARLLGRRAGLVAGMLVALDPFLVFFSSLLLTETLFLAVVCTLWWIVAPLWLDCAAGLGRWVAAGVAAAVCIYARESSVGLVALALLGAVCCRRSTGRSWIGAIIACAIIVAALTPWAVRNRRTVGEWRWLTTRGGISVYDGVGPQATGSSDLGDVKAGPSVHGLNETEWDRYFRDEARRAIVADPFRVLRLAVVKIGRMWNPFPNALEYRSRMVRWVSASWMVPVLLLALAGAILVGLQFATGGARRACFLLLPAMYLTALHSLFVGSVRYRLGAMPMLEVLAAYALVRITARRRRGAAENDGNA